MAIIKRVKDWLGIEGVKIDLSVAETFKIKDGVITGRYSINSQSDQYIECIKLVLKEKYIRGRRKTKLIDEYVLADQLINIKESIAPEEIITHPFELEFSTLKSAVDRFGDKNFVFRGLVSIAKLVKNAKSTYTLTAEVTVKGNKLKPYDTVRLVAE